MKPSPFPSGVLTNYLMLYFLAHGMERSAVGAIAKLFVEEIRFLAT